MTDVKTNLERRRRTNRMLHESFLQDTYAQLRGLELPDIPSDSDKYAVILEPRIDRNFDYVLRNIMYFLGEGWGLHIVCGRSNCDFVNDFVKGWGGVLVTVLDFENLSRDEFRTLRKSTEFWNLFRGDKLLCFELDTLLCRSGIQEYIHFDYIGAPWAKNITISDVVRVGNGGLSLRSKQAMIDMTIRGKPIVIPSEDSYFSIHLHLHKDEYCLPDVETARTFSVETMFHPAPFGIHKPWMYLSRAELLTIYDGINYQSK